MVIFGAEQNPGLAVKRGQPIIKYIRTLGDGLLWVYFLWNLPG